MPVFVWDYKSCVAQYSDALDGFLASARGSMVTRARLTGLRMRRLLSRGRRMVRRAGLSLAGAGRYARSEDKRPIIRLGECHKVNGNLLSQLIFSFSGADVSVELGSVYDGEIAIIK